VRVTVLARFQERSLATVGELRLMSLEAFADVAMPSLGVLAESISVGRAGHMHARDLASTLVWGRPRRRLRVSARRDGKEAAECHQPSDLREHLPLSSSEDVQAFAHLAVGAHVLT